MTSDRTCPHCDQVIPPEFWLNSSWADHTEVCRDNLKKQFDELHVMWKNVSGALCDAGSVIIYERDYARSVRELTAQREREAARAAKAIELAEELIKLAQELINYVPDYFRTKWKFDEALAELTREKKAD
jgi:hypothetical protein